jgi:hypothetical protein
LAGKSGCLRKCTYKRYQSTLTAAGNPRITTHPSIIGRTGEEWDGMKYLGYAKWQYFKITEIELAKIVYLV